VRLVAQIHWKGKAGGWILADNLGFVGVFHCEDFGEISVEEGDWLKGGDRTFSATSSDECQVYVCLLDSKVAVNHNNKE
jgi:hypothetical protein